MRQVLPTKPLTRAIRYGPGFFSHWKNLVCADHGLKHWALAPGPDTILGPAQTATDDSNRLVSAKPVARPICLMGLVLPFRAPAVQPREMRVFAPADATMPPQPRGFQSMGEANCRAKAALLRADACPHVRRWQRTAADDI